MNKLITEKERVHYEKILATNPPIEALLNRVLIVQIREEDEIVENIEIPGFEMGPMTKVGSIVMPKSSKERMKSESETVKGVVKSMGPFTDLLTHPWSGYIDINDVVFVFPSVFETKWTFDGIDYFSYSYRDIVAKVK